MTFLFFFTSLGLLGTLIMVFKYEAAHNVRFFVKIRDVLDRVAARIFAHTMRYDVVYCVRVLRQSFHYIMHVLLLVCMRISTRAAERFDELIRANRRVARHTYKKTQDSKNILHEAILHKKHTALSEDERRVYKERSIGSKL